MSATVSHDPAGAGAAPMVVLRLFAQARQAAGTGRAELRAATVTELLAEAGRRWGDAFGAVVATSRIWVNGEPVDSAAPLRDGDEVAVLPPVSGGCGR